MRIATWNVNSIRARLPIVCSWLAEHRPDVLCLQETKVEDEKFPGEEFGKFGYQICFFGQRTYNGVAILSRSPVKDLCKGLPGLPEDEQRRFLAGTLNGIRILNIYIPNGQAVDSPKFLYKLHFVNRLRAFLETSHRPGEPLILLGDFNVAPEPEDVYSPEEWEGEVLFHPDARAAIGTLKAWGLVDLFRKHHAGPGHYTWWDYRVGAFRRNMGLRIDHIWATQPVADRCGSCEIDRSPRAGERPSDHAPVIASIDGF